MSFNKLGDVNRLKSTGKFLIITLVVVVAVSLTLYIPLTNAFQTDNRPCLTDEQRSEIKQLINEMIEETRGEIADKLSEWGIDTPILTDVKKQELRNLIRDMIEDGSKRDEIRDEVVAKLSEWGIDTPILTDVKKQELRNLIRDAITETRGEIADKLNEWGIETPLRLGRHRRLIRRRIRRIRWVRLHNQS